MAIMVLTVAVVKETVVCSPSQNFSSDNNSLVWWHFINLAERCRSLLAFVKEYVKRLHK